MQNQGVIEESKNVMLFTLLSIVFWVFPINKYLNQKDKEHNRVAKKINTSLLGMFLTAVVIGLLMNL
jgi:hypothetical protein